jgi:hypothetical protein
MAQLPRVNRFISTFVFSVFLVATAAAQGVINVTVDPGKPLNPLTSQLVGAWADLGDGDLTDPKFDAMLKSAGVSSLTYPTTAWTDLADIYHWSNNQLTPNAGNADDIRKPYIQGKNDFAAMAIALAKYGIVPIVHVNYGSNLKGTGGGEPMEAAAWVAYANGSPSDTRAIGKDSTGTDWKTVGFWATARGEAPLNADDGYNFLRVEHPEPFHISMWQIGDEVYQNGYYGSDKSATLDLHAPYPASKKDNGKRKKLPQLAPRTYGEQLVAFATAMKAVDPSIQVGATLTLPTATIDKPEDRYASDWNPTVLKLACKDIDFVSYTWHPGGSSDAEQWKYLDDPSLLGAVSQTLPSIFKETLYEDKTNCPAGKVPHVAFSQFSGPQTWPAVQRPIVLALFAADMYASLGESGIANADWGQLRVNGMFDGAKPTPIFYGTQMAHIVAFKPGDSYVAATSAKSLSVHASNRQDGVVGVLLINEDRQSEKQVRINFAGGAQLGPTGFKFEYGPAQLAQGAGPVRSNVTVDGNSVTVTVPAYGLVDVLIKKK